VDDCAQCGYDYAALDRRDLPAEVERLAAGYHRRLATTDPALLRVHWTPGVWSALEYACHVRDMLVVQRERIALALAEPEPQFEPMERDERVTRDRYNGQRPEAVAAELDQAGAQLAAALRALDDAGWQRTGFYNYPEVRRRDVEWIARHTIHEQVHHLLDVDRLLDRPSGGAPAGADGSAK
jgi:S-DNA-T family DNA segregation ATPase FtsK/SpoIIIE